jgi:hypothetical protein
VAQPENKANPKTINIAKRPFSFHSSFFYGCLTAPPTPVESTTAEDNNQNNDYKYGFRAHDFSPFS